MKIVVNAYSARLGGGQTYLRNLFTHLPLDPSVDVHVFASDSLRLPAHPQLKRVRTRWPTTNPLARAVWERFGLRSYLRREKVDLLFCPGGVVGTRAPSHCKVATMFRNMIPFDDGLLQKMPWGLQRLRNLILKRLLLRSMAGADLTIFISDYARKLIEKQAHIPNPVTIPHGISDAFRHTDIICPRPKEAPAGHYLLYVSRFDIYKHHREVVQAFAALPEELRDCLNLVFLGETDMPEVQDVIRLVKVYGLSSNVFMLGAVSHDALPAWYQNAKAIIFASSCENCPNILLESLGSGRPVLSSNVMPMPEFGGDELAYFSPFDAKDLSKLLTRVLSDEDYAARIVLAATERSRRYEWKATARETWRLLFQVVEQ